MIFVRVASDYGISRQPFVDALGDKAWTLQFFVDGNVPVQNGILG